MKNKIVYGSLFCVILYLTLLYDLKTMRFLLFFLILLPLTLLIWLIISKKRMHVYLTGEEKVVFRGDIYEVPVWTDNHNFLPVPRVRIKMQVRETISQTQKKSQLLILADGKEKKSTEQKCKAIHCGHYTWNIQEVCIYDYLGIFCRKLKVPETALEVLVFPAVHIFTRIDRIEGWRVEMEEEYEENRPGDEVSQIFQIRSYQGGDAMQRIHWKMTAKEDEIMVKDYARPRGNHLLLVLEFFTDEKIVLGCLDDFLELVVSISMSLIGQNLSHQVMWCKDHQAERMYVEREEQVYHLISRLLHTQLSLKSMDENKVWELAEREAGGRHLYRLDQKLCFYKDQDLCMDFRTVEKDEWEKQWIRL